MLIQGIQALAQYYRVELEPRTLGFYTHGLETLPFTVVMAALDRATAVHKFMPRVTELRDLVKAQADRKSSARTVPEQITRPPCACIECEMAGVAEEDQRFVPVEDHGVRGRWIHARELAAWLNAQREFYAKFRAMVHRLRGEAGT